MHFANRRMLNMRRQAKAVQPEPARAAHRALATTVLIAALALVITLMASAAQACPRDQQTAYPATNGHKIERVVVVAAVVVSVPTPIVAQGIFQYGGQCCGGGCHSHGVACASGCCSSGSTAIDAVSSGLVMPDSLIRYSSRGPGRIVSTNPSPNLRPPEILSELPLSRDG